MTGLSGLYKNTKGARIAAGETTDYKERMKEEYHQLKDRAEKLHKMLTKHAEGTLDFTPTCDIGLLERQFIIMNEYMHILEKRAEIEHIEL